MGKGRHDRFAISENAAVADNVWRIGRAGINLDPQDNVLDDVEYTLRGVDRVDANAGDGTDEIKARGEAGTGKPFAAKLLLFGGNGADTLYGGNGNDQLRGYYDQDVVAGFRGDDEIEGEGGNDNVFGESGNDHVSGGPGFDRIFGNNGIDKLDAVDAPAFADQVINCGDGQDSKESAKLDAADPPAFYC
jgi:Ca2+-binding RTX toxin-like protein